MPGVCFACDTELDESHPSCPGCGFPSSLESEAAPTFDRVEPPPPRETPSKRSSDRGRAKARRPADHEIQNAAREARYSVQLVSELGGERGPLVEIVPRAAVLDGIGRAPEALQLLRESQEQAIARAGELFEDHLQKLHKRQVALVVAGFDPGPLQGASRLRAEFAELPLDVVARHLLEEEQLIGRTENEWAELRERLALIETMRRRGLVPNDDLKSANAEVARIQSLLARQSFVPAELDQALAVTQPVVASYQKEAKARLQGELVEHGRAVERLLRSHPSAHHVRGLHSAATQQLEQGDLTEALQTIDSLREELNEIGSTARAPSPSNEETSEDHPVPIISAPSGADTSPEETKRLLRRAREIAQRLRSLPPDNPRTFDAARLMRSLVGALREDKFDAARSTLLELAQVLQDFDPTEAT